jgi:hypothetical protein
MTAKTKRENFWKINCELIRRGFSPVSIPGIVSRWQNQQGIAVIHSRRTRDVTFVHENGLERVHRNLSFELFVKLLNAIEEKKS